MPLKLDGEDKSLFSHNREYDEGVKQRGIRPGQATIVVALDGSGDAESIQEGIDMLPDTGGTVYIKEGLYLIDISITITKANTSLIGSGKSTEIKATANWGFPSEELITGTSNTKGSYQYLYLNTTGADIKGIRMGADSFMGYCWVENGSDSAIYTANNCIVIQNRITDAANIEIRGTYNEIMGNIISGGGILAYTNNAVIVGNVCISATSRGIDIDSDRNLVANNKINNCFLGIEVSVGAGKNLITGNTLYNNTTNYTDLGTNTQPNGVMGTNNLAFDDLNMIT